MLPTVRCLVVQFYSVQQPLMAFGIVPKAVVQFNFVDFGSAAIPDLEIFNLLAPKLPLASSECRLVSGDQLVREATRHRQVADIQMRCLSTFGLTLGPSVKRVP